MRPPRATRRIEVTVTEWCQRCGRVRNAGDWTCPVCGCSTFGDHVPATAAAVGVSPPLPLHGVLARALEMPARYVLALHGVRGGGKSTVAFSAFARPHIVTSEMGTDRVLDYLARMGQSHGGMTVPRLVEDEDGRRIDLGRIGPDVRELVLDSASACPDPTAAVLAVRRWVDDVGGRAIVILHHTKAGEPAGEARMLHACDGEAEIIKEGERRRVAVTKHRAGECKTVPFELAATGAQSTVRPRYYSIEGRSPHYRLVPYPSPESGPYAAYLKAAESALHDDDAPAPKLPPPPVAVCALSSALYGRGWCDPVDAEERQAFAEAAGVPYFSPSMEPS